MTFQDSIALEGIHGRERSLATVLVTGGAGFIGSHIVDLLLHTGWRVVVVDNFSKGSKKNLQKNFQQNLRQNPKLSIVEADVSNVKSLLQIFEKQRPVAVVHAAAQVSVYASISDPILDATTNIKGMVALLECCKQTGVQRVVYLSSGGAVYGIPFKLPCTEQTPVLPVNNYGVSKYTAEQYLKTYHALYGINFCILRLTNTYGPRQNPHGESGVIAIFADKLLRGEQPIIYGDGTQTRDFVYVEDVAEAVLLALERTTRNLPSPFDERVFNISFGEAISINTLAKLLQKAIQECTGQGACWGHTLNSIGSLLQPLHEPARPGEVHDMVLDSSLAKKALGWVPRTSIEEGIKKTIAWRIDENRQEH
ncbi:GDP-mannose 4,6-dehydratase [Candidatus Woesearchaeota archaeon]|nr:GDP-mannose 4,6-dehydratase [Candidatus Woesearchaeota archaeon]